MKDLLKNVTAVAYAAGEEILMVYSRGDFGTTFKEGGSPLTLADEAAHRAIIKGLEAIDPSIPVLSEESSEEDYAGRRGWMRFWMVDPLDGTKEFIKRNGEFTVNIALIENGEAILGVVYAPVLGVAYYAAKGVGAFRIKDGIESPIKAADHSKERLKIVGSRSHATPELEAFIKKAGDAEFVSMGSSLKFCLVADGTAHLYPRFGPTMEWDTAAAQCVVEAAGGRVTDLDGKPLRYNKEDLANLYFVVAGDPPFPWERYIVKS